MTIPGIILLTPNRVWRTYQGGRTLDQLAGNEGAPDSHLAEDWIASTTRAINKGREAVDEEGYSSVHINGNDYLLKELMEEYPEVMIGDDHYKKYGANSQFLLKFIDSSIRLHIQAHPTISFAKRYLDSDSGKTEAYVILHIREEVPEPYIYLGFQHPLSREAFKRAVETQDEAQILAGFEKIPVKPGDVFFVPGGLPHAIGEGIFMVEIMEPTDLVVRFEFERGGYTLPEGARFMNRGIDFALDMMSFEPLPVETIREKYFCNPVVIDKGAGYQEALLIGPAQTPCFSVHSLTVTGQYTRASNAFHVAIVTKGDGVITVGEEHIRVTNGDKFIVPFQTKTVTYSSTGEMDLVLTFPPGAMS